MRRRPFLRASLTALLVAHTALLGQTPQRGEANRQPVRGLRFKCEGASPGYTLFAPMGSTTTYLIDIDGLVIRTWKSSFVPSAWVHFLDSGHVLRGGSDPGTAGFRGGGQGGRFQEFDFDGKLVWDFALNEDQLPHHDAAVLPNGNILAIVWEARSMDAARRAGRREAFIPGTGMWPDAILELEPQRPSGAKVVWEWHIWDHLIQNVNPALANYGNPAEHPERIDINGDTLGSRLALPNASGDVFHTNAISYNPELDQIVLSVPTFNEIWVIDHSTTTEQAAGREGGRSGKGGDLLFRWGNPQAFGHGTASDRRLGFPHDSRWIPKGRPGEGHLLVFNNRTPDPAGTFSSVYELVPPMNEKGNYAFALGQLREPADAFWTYSDGMAFQAPQFSGAERLATGNTLISSGPQGRVFEVTPGGRVVWEYWSPYAGTAQSGNNSFSFFRAVRIDPNHPGLKGHSLQPLSPQPLAESPLLHGWGLCAPS